MPERQSRAYAIVQELRLLGGFAEFTFDEATADNLRSAKTPSSVQYFGFQRPDGANFSIRHYPGWGKKAGDIICCAGKIDELGQTPAPPSYQWKDTNTRRTDYDIAGAIAAARPAMEDYWQAGLIAKADAMLNTPRSAAWRTASPRPAPAKPAMAPTSTTRTASGAAAPAGASTISATPTASASSCSV